MHLSLGKDALVSLQDSWMLQKATKGHRLKVNAGKCPSTFKQLWVSGIHIASYATGEILSKNQIVDFKFREIFH